MKPGRKPGHLNQSHAVAKRPKQLSLTAQLREPHGYHQGRKGRLGKSAEDSRKWIRNVAERVMRLADERLVEDVLTEDERWVLEFARR